LQRTGEGGNHPAVALFDEERTAGGGGGERTLGGTYLSVLQRAFVRGSLHEGGGRPSQGNFVSFLIISIRYSYGLKSENIQWLNLNVFPNK
jgi:hypothetical protein